MKRTLAIATAVFLAFGREEASAERAQAPADATVFIRLVGSVHADIDEAGLARQSIDLERIEIGSGSGFIISPHGYVLTNEHVISNRELTVEDGSRKARINLKVSRIDVCFPESTSSVQGGGSRCFQASVQSSDAALDLAVLFISASDLPYVALGDSDVLRSGQGVTALGYPFGRELEVGRIAAPDLVPEVSTSRGTISALRADDSGERRALQINSVVNPGNSGGPVVDERGYAVGVIRARVKGDAGIGFAIPINQAKDFLESHGLDALMPSHRVRLGAIQRFEGKGIELRMPDGFSDASPLRSRVETPPELADVALRIDRSVSPWTARQLERTLLQTESFERISIESRESEVAPQAGRTPLLAGRASGTEGNRREVAMHYAILDLGEEKLIARYVGSAEQLAYNESIFRDSLRSLEGQRLIASGAVMAGGLQWAAAAAGVNLPFPSGWVVEPGAPSPCAGLAQPAGTAAAYPARDVTLALRVAVWDVETVQPRQAASSCSTRRGSAGDSSYVLRADWLGVPYAIEGFFARVGSRQLQLEVISPERNAPAARAILDAWIKKITETVPTPRE